MPSIIFDNDLKKKFEGIRGKFLSTGLFINLTRAETLELMIDSLNRLEISTNIPFHEKFISEILKERKEKK